MSKRNSLMVIRNTPLAANGVFSSLPFSSDANNKIIGSVFANVAGTLVIKQSFDGANYDVVDTIAVTANTPTKINLDVYAKQVMVVYTNGATLQTTFRLNVGLRDK